MSSLAPYYAVLAFAVVAVSSAGVALKEIDAPPLLKAHWRLFTTSLLLLPGFVVQAAADARAPRKDAVLSRLAQPRNVAVVCASGAALAAHFGLWVYSLDHTSLAHSLILVVSHPLIVALVMLAAGRRLSALEAAGVAVGLAGAGVIMLDVKEDTEVTVWGDLAAFGGAACMVVYLFAGRHLREWLPLFLYAFPVTFIASLAVLGASLAAEGGVRADGRTTTSVFGWLGAASAPLVAYVSVVSGIGGHTGVNLVLRKLEPIVVSVALTLEPLFGVLIGVALGDAVPGTWTLVGGPLNMTGTVLAVYGSHRREQAELARGREETAAAVAGAGEVVLAGAGADAISDMEDVPLTEAAGTASEV